MWNLKAAIFLFYGVTRKKVNCCVCGGFFFPVLQVWCVCVLLSARERLWNCVLLMWVKFYIIVYFVYICVDGVQVDFCCVVYD